MMNGNNDRKRRLKAGGTGKKGSLASEQDRFYSTMFAVDEPHPLKIMEEPDREGRSSTDADQAAHNVDGVSSNKSGDSQRKNNKVPLGANAMMDEVMDGILKNRESRGHLTKKTERVSYMDPNALGGGSSRTFRESRLGQDASTDHTASTHDSQPKVDNFNLSFSISGGMNSYLENMRTFQLNNKQALQEYVVSKGALMLAKLIPDKLKVDEDGQIKPFAEKSEKMFGDISSIQEDKLNFNHEHDFKEWE